jgi:methenyltetrahydromethanopterin cyclohydrolase
VTEVSVSVNMNALQTVKQMIDDAEELNCAVSELENGTTVLDAGVFTSAGSEAGRLIAEVCMGGLGSVRLTQTHIAEMTLPAVVVGTNEPSTATLASQLAGWSIKVGDYHAMCSGPARALAQSEELYSELGYHDDSKFGVLVMETRQMPPPEVTQVIADACHISPSELYCVVVPTASPAGSVQIAARIVEAGVHRLHRLGFSPAKIRTGHGVAPIAPVAKSDSCAMGLANDCILYGGRIYLHVSTEDNDDIEALAKRAPACSSRQYGTPFYELFKSVDSDSQRIDPDLLSGAEVTLIDIHSGAYYKAGGVDAEVLRKSLQQYLPYGL